MTISFADQRHIYINRQSYREDVDAENKVISQNSIQKIANIVILQRVLFIKLVSQCKTNLNFHDSASTALIDGYHKTLLDIINCSKSGFRRK